MTGHAKIDRTPNDHDDHGERGKEPWSHIIEAEGEIELCIRPSLLREAGLLQATYPEDEYGEIAGDVPTEVACHVEEVQDGEWLVIAVESCGGDMVDVPTKYQSALADGHEERLEEAAETWEDDE